MKLLICLLLTVLLADADIACDSGKVFIKIEKISKTYANEESVLVTSGATTVISAVTYTNQSVRSDEYCVNDASGHTYTLQLKDTQGDGWTSGAYVKVHNRHNSVAFIGFLATGNLNNIDLLMYQPVYHGLEWKYSGSFTSGWTGTSFSDGGWTSVTLPTPSQATTGTQYLRKTFTSISNAAAVEMQFFFKCGVVGYVNGVEYFRDNIDTQVTVQQTTPAEGCYSENNYHGVVRNGLTMTSGSAVFAVELHFLSEPATTSINFDAWLSFYGSSIENTRTGVEKCYTIPQIPTITATSNQGGAVSFLNFGRVDSWTHSLMATQAASVTMQYIDSTYQVNGFAYFPSTGYSFAPKDLSVYGSMSYTTTGTFDILGALVDMPLPASNTYQYYTLPFSVSAMRTFRVTFTKGYNNNLYIYEFNPMVCSTQIATTMVFSPNEYVAYKDISLLTIKPTPIGLTTCEISPSLPSGMSLTSACYVTGTPTVTLSRTEFTVTSILPALSGKFYLTVNACSGQIGILVRKFTSQSLTESVVIKSTSGTTIYSQPVNSDQQDSTTVTSRVCFSQGNRYNLILSGTNVYWSIQSNIEIQSFITSTDVDPILRTRLDQYIPYPDLVEFTVYRPLAVGTTWKYKHAYSSSDWHSADTSSWSSASMGSFGSSTNQFQIYRNTFTVDSSEWEKAGNYIMALRYQYGVVVYLNGHEAYRNHVADGAIEGKTSFYYYPALSYRLISLPVRSIGNEENPAIQFLKSGSNEIAIAIITASTSGSASTFDCSIRLGSRIEEDRVMDFTTAMSGLVSPSDYPFLKSGSLTFYLYNCQDSYQEITFNNERREWISSVTFMNSFNTNAENMKGFMLQAKNPTDEDWTTLATEDNWKWWIAAQMKRLYIFNNKAYNKYRLTNARPQSTTSCPVRLCQIILWADKTDRVTADLSYPPTNTGFANIEMAEIFPLQGVDYLFNFTVTPTLPNGLFIDPPSGVIMGTPTVATGLVSYFISALSITGVTKSASFSLDIINCEGGRSLISAIVRTDYYPVQNEFTLYNGRGTSGTVVRTLNGLPMSGSKYWVDECLPHQLYTFVLKDTGNDGLIFPGGVSFSIDLDTLFFHQSLFPSATASISHTFSSYLPFEVVFTKWSIYCSATAVAANWNKLEFTPGSGWRNDVLAADFGTHAAITAYVRKTFDIPSLTDYVIMNGHLYFSGGVMMYLNGKLIGRFNMPRLTLADTLAPAAEAGVQNVYNKFSFVLSSIGAVQGNNVVGFEIHRIQGSSSSEKIVFDASAVFGVNDCNYQTYRFFGFKPLTDASKPVAGVFDDCLDGDITTTCTFPNIEGGSWDWKFDNAELNQFNNYVIWKSMAHSGYTFSLYGKNTASETEDYTEMYIGISLAFVDRTLKYFPLPVGMGGFRYYRLDMDQPGASTILASEFALFYCKPQGVSCTGDGEYPSVGNGEISPARCPSGYTGYAYRKCASGVLSEPMLDMCFVIAPTAIQYGKLTYQFIVGLTLTTGEPACAEKIETYSLAEGVTLPVGLSLNHATGEITGSAVEEQSMRSYKIYATNAKGAVSTDVSIGVRLGECKADGVFLTTPAGSSFIYDCALDGAYMGTRSRECKLGEKDGEWANETGYCLSVWMIVIVILVVVLIIVVVIFIVVRVSRKKSKKGGVGKKGSASASKSKADTKKKAPAAKKSKV